jgi:3-hydroxyacyl-[acyl-carrier-protein] dehydratase
VGELMALLTKEQIKDIIPHRYEMLLIDEIISMDDVTVVGKKYLTADDWFFKGHFPQEPVMPGVLQIETAAQAGAVLLLSKEENKNKTAYFGGIDKIKFRQKAVPGDELTFELTLVASKMNIGKAKAVCKNQNNQKIFSGELTFIVN